MVLELEMVPNGAVYFMDAGFHVSSMVKADSVNPSSYGHESHS